MGIIETLQEENRQLRREFEEFRQEVRLWMEDIGDDMKGNEAAAKFISVSVSTLLRIRERPEYGIVYRHEGTVVVYSRSSLVAYKKGRMIKKSA